MASPTAVQSTETSTGDAETVTTKVEHVRKASSPASLGPVSAKRTNAEALSNACDAMVDDNWRRLLTSGSKEGSPTAGFSTSPVDMGSRTERAVAYDVGLQQVVLQAVLLLSSWAFLALLQPKAHSLLLLTIICLSRLHLGWLVCCVFRMLVTGCRYVKTPKP